MTGTDTIERKSQRKKTSAAPASRLERLPKPLRRLLDFFSSLKLTVAFLCLGLLLIFIGTLAQVHEGLWDAQHRYFRSFFIWWGTNGASWKIPFFPGVLSGADRGEPIVVSEPDTPAATALFELAGRLSGLLASRDAPRVNAALP